MSSLDFLFDPERIALIGAAHTEEKLGGIVLKNLLRFRGKVYPVNPKYRELMGVPAFAAINDIPERVDTAIIMRPAEEVPGILKELKDRATSAIIVSSGFSETGREDLQNEVQHIGREAGIRLLGPNCMGVYNIRRRLDTFFISYEKLKRPKQGNIALLSQSGAVMTCLFESIRDSNTGVAKAVGIGNAVDIDIPDIYEYFAHDPDTAIVISYIESLGDGRRFIEAAKRLSERKSLIVLKSGKGSIGQAAAYSHTGRLAGKYEVFNSIMRQFGIKEVNNFDELIDAAKALSYQKPSRGNRVCIITNGGGSGVLAADECMRQGLEVARVSDEKLKKLKELFPPFYGMNNPVDLTAQVKDEDYATTLETLKGDYDGFLIIALTGVAGITEQLAGIVESFKIKTGKPIVAYTANSMSHRLNARLERAGIPVYPSPERAIRGLKALLG